MIVSGPWLPLAALATPLMLGLLAAIPAVRPRALLLLPLAPLPGLTWAVSGPTGLLTEVHPLLLGARLGLDGAGALFLGVAALVWALAGLFAVAYLRRTPQRAPFVSFWCLTLAGNLGVFAARDAATFYVSFAAVSLPAYVLVVHEATAAAQRAGRIYLVLAVLGETCLIAGLIIACAQADALGIAEVREALAAAPQRDGAVALMLIGFGIKAGLVPLHVWLPLAHPEAPTPASAVLSGAIVKAGLFGMLRFMPQGTGMEEWSLLLVALGLIGAYYGVVLGLSQGNPKATLAYSTVSQMGLMIAAVGAATRAEAPAAAAVVIALYAAHHGAAKGALFLSVGVAGRSTPRERPLVLAVAALVALSVAGLPLTGGAVVKTALKGELHGLAKTLFSASAAGTALMLLHFWRLLRREPPSSQTRAGLSLFGPFLAAASAALALPWFLLPAAELEAASMVTEANLWSAGWPLILAAALFGGARALRMSALRLPAGDLVVLAERLAPSARPRCFRAPAGARRRPSIPFVVGRIGRIERILRRWSAAGTLLVAAAVLLAASLLVKVE